MQVQQANPQITVGLTIKYCTCIEELICCIFCCKMNLWFIFLWAFSFVCFKILLFWLIVSVAGWCLFQIPVRADLPVGENFQDHPMCIIEYKVDRPLSVSMDHAYYQTPASKEYQQYMFFVDGMDCFIYHVRMHEHRISLNLVIIMYLVVHS